MSFLIIIFMKPVRLSVITFFPLVLKRLGDLENGDICGVIRV